jgi:hypothetical protein
VLDPNPTAVTANPGRRQSQRRASQLEDPLGSKSKDRHGERDHCASVRAYCVVFEATIPILSRVAVVDTTIDNGGNKERSGAAAGSADIPTK